MLETLHLCSHSVLHLVRTVEVKKQTIILMHSLCSGLCAWACPVSVRSMVLENMPKISLFTAELRDVGRTLFLFSDRQLLFSSPPVTCSWDKSRSLLLWFFISNCSEINFLLLFWSKDWCSSISLYDLNLKFMEGMSSSVHSSGDFSCDWSTL